MNNDMLEDMKMSMQMLPMIASAIRKLRMQNSQEKTDAVNLDDVIPPQIQKPKYQQNKWEVSPSG